MRVPLGPVCLLPPRSACLRDNGIDAGGQGCNQFEPRRSSRETTPLGHPKKAAVSDDVALPMRNVAEWRQNNATLRQQKFDQERKKRQLSVENLVRARESTSPVQGVSEQVKAEVAAEAARIRRGVAANNDRGHAGGDGAYQKKLNDASQRSSSSQRATRSRSRRPRRPRSALEVRWKPRVKRQSGGAWSLENLRAVQVVRYFFHS